MLEIIIEEVAINPVIQVEEVISTVTVQITEMQTPGPIGPQGTAGVDGVDGADGKSAYQSALDGGFIGTELEFNISLANQINFSQVNTYALMLSITVSSKLIIVKVLNDENKGIENTIYHIYPDGVRMWIASVQDN